MNEKAVAIIIFVTVALLFLGLISDVYLNMTLPEKDYCTLQSGYSVKNLPVKCLKYYQQQV